jgi:HNH endonuclease
MDPPTSSELLAVQPLTYRTCVPLCAARIASDLDPVGQPSSFMPGSTAPPGRITDEIEDGTAIHPETLSRLMCSARVQTVLEDGGGRGLRLGRISREPTAWMIRQVRHRDRECRFPGCGARRFTQAHHIRWWREGGRTDLDDLVLICSFHHKLVHEYGWRLVRDADGSVRWFHPDGTRYRAGPTSVPRAEAS